MYAILRILPVVLASGVVAVSPASGSDLTRMSSQTAPALLRPAPGYCCLNGVITASDERSCTDRKGRYSTDPAEIQRICRTQQPPARSVAPVTVPAMTQVRGYCCSNNRVLSLTKPDCERRNGLFFSDREAALSSCRPAAAGSGGTVTGAPVLQAPPQAVDGMRGPPIGNPPPPQPHYPPHHGDLAVSSPHQGEFFTAGQQHDIVWDVHGYLTTDCAQIFLYQGNNQVSIISQQVLGRDTPGQAGYHWNVPSQLAGDYTVKVRTCDGEAEDFSDPFRINSQNPDLNVSGVSVSPSNPNTGDTIRVQGWVTNMGLTVVDSARVTLTVRDPDGIEHQFHSSFSNLHFGSPYQFTKFYKVNRAGTYQNIVHADTVLATAVETHLGDNEATVDAVIDGLPDLIACMWVNPVVNALHQDEVWGYIRNIGDKQSLPTTARIWIEGKGGTNVNIPLLVAGDSYRVGRNVTWGPQGPDKDFSIEADPGNNIAESREDNNKQMGTIVIQGSLAQSQDPETLVESCSGTGTHTNVGTHPYTVTEQSQ
jgi:hypothetical protein